MKFNLVTIRPQGFAHSNGFRELQESVGWALAVLGHESNITENTFSEDGHNIVFGAELISKDSQLPPNATIYNIEQDSHPAFANVLDFGRKVDSVWEYSNANMRHWKGVNAVHVPFGFTPNLARIPNAYVKDIDVFFSGWLTERRKKIIDELRSRKLNVVAVDSCYGGSRDCFISRAKICLNVNHDGRNRTNIQRLSFWMANSKCIVSETSSDMHDYDDLLPSMVMCEYDEILDTCCNLIDHGRIREMGELALEAIQKRNYVSFVGDALNHQPARNPILERYEKGCREGDMKEYLPWIRANAKGNCLEIGVRDGASTAAFLLGLEQNGGRLQSYDINDCSNLWSHPQWAFSKADTQSAYFRMCINEPFDIALVDGDHSRDGVKNDLVICFEAVRNGGIVLVHDTHPPKTFEEFGGDWPSVAVGEEFRKFCIEKGLTNFELPGTQGMGVLVVKK